MRFSNDGSTYSAYQPYAATAPWTLTSGDGLKTVYAQFRDADGNESLVVSDTITMDTKGPKAKKLRPAKGADDVARSVTVKVKASEKLMAASVRAKTVFLKAAGSRVKLRAKVSYHASSKTIVLNPKGNLRRGTKYTVTVTRVKDVLGNRWDQKPKKSGAQALRFSFTTG
jgi:hypothetical protein